jgi:hypothetical protein
MEEKHGNSATTKKRWGSKLFGMSRKPDSGTAGKTFQVASVPKKLLVDTEGKNLLLIVFGHMQNSNFLGGNQAALDKLDPS